MKTYTSDEILYAEDLYELQDTFSSSAIPFKYQLTEEEVGWVYHTLWKYAITSWVWDNLEYLGDVWVVTFNCPFELSKALSDDGMAPKAVMLSDNTALQRLFFWLYNEE